MFSTSVIHLLSLIITLQVSFVPSYHPLIQDFSHHSTRSDTDFWSMFLFALLCFTNTATTSPIPDLLLIFPLQIIPWSFSLCYLTQLRLFRKLTIVTFKDLVKFALRNLSQWIAELIIRSYIFCRIGNRWQTRANRIDLRFGGMRTDGLRSWAAKCWRKAS